MTYPDIIARQLRIRRLAWQDQFAKSLGAAAFAVFVAAVEKGADE